MTRADLASTLKQAMRGFPKSVSIVTAHWQGRDYAMAASTADSVTLDPPAMLVSINRNASIWRPLSEGVDFAINLIGADQRDLIAHCSASSGEARFERGDWVRDGRTPPKLLSGLSYIRCHPAANLIFGSHEVFIGAVSEIDNAPSGDALAYVGGAFHRVLHRVEPAGG